MTRTARAVVARELSAPVVVETINVEPPRRGEVTIRLAACGVCHSDLSATNGTIAFPMPIVLGHEGAGTVVEVGEGVAEYVLGDRVISSFVSSADGAAGASPAVRSCATRRRGRRGRCPTARCAQATPRARRSTCSRAAA